VVWPQADQINFQRFSEAKARDYWVERERFALEQKK